MARLPPLNALRVFLAAAATRSFTRAGEQLFLTQGAVSRQVQTLEAFYGTPLFVRGRRGLALTPEGEALYAPVRDAFDRLQAASEALKRRQGDLRVRSPATPAMRWLLPNLPSFQQLYPEYTVHLITQLDPDLPFNRAEYDLAIVGLRDGELPAGLAGERIAQEELVAVCAPALLARAPLKVPADLARHTLLHPWRGDDTWARYLEKLGVAGEVDAARGVTFDTQEYALAAALGGMGVTLAQRSMIEGELSSGRLLRPFAESLYTEWAYYLVYPRENAGQPKLAAFRDWLLGVLGAPQASAGLSV
ncbi:LysR substrate-binding domain-containing protein [Crenobacter caeni]|uniref:LysR family transcriptional regulator n=1 Tax=Crenobacter caeni TaxID=2705474 RepID=A0A6B2KW03_9NEIS|nr:LysR substrate-binding domain-containing protein [Crenobacter caeni]NDV14200.1 LysR family transcriptional regulator [Crenobacter caeni]